MDAAEESFDEAHLQSLASSLGKKNPATDADAPGVYVKDPQCQGASPPRSRSSWFKSPGSQRARPARAVAPSRSRPA